MHGGTSFLYKNEYNIKYKNLWQSSHVIVATSKEMDWKIAGYIGGNLLKHKEVSTFQELEDNPFSSYWYLIKKYGNKLAQELIKSVIDVGEDKKGRINEKKLGKLKLHKPSAKAG